MYMVFKIYWIYKNLCPTNWKAKEIVWAERKTEILTSETKFCLKWILIVFQQKKIYSEDHRVRHERPW